MERWDFYTGSDASLAAFLAELQAAGPKCAACGDGPAAHLASYLHASSRISFSVTHLPPAQALPGADHGQIWTWARPQEVTYASQSLTHSCWPVTDILCHCGGHAIQQPWPTCLQAVTYLDLVLLVAAGSLN